MTVGQVSEALQPHVILLYVLVKVSIHITDSHAGEASELHDLTRHCCL